MILGILLPLEESQLLLIMLVYTLIFNSEFPTLTDPWKNVLCSVLWSHPHCQKWLDSIRVRNIFFMNENQGYSGRLWLEALLQNVKCPLGSFVLTEWIKGQKTKRILIRWTQMYRNLRQELLTRIYSLFPVPSFKKFFMLMYLALWFTIISLLN